MNDSVQPEGLATRRGTMARRVACFALSLVVVLVASAIIAVSPARAWLGDFFDGDASGQATYEEMVIHSQAVEYDGVTYVVYQGALLDPYIVAYEHATKRWQGPVRIGPNPLGGSWDPDDSHGAPALLVDRANGYLHVFWGAHNRPLEHARSANPKDISRWLRRSAIGRNLTYPQVFTGTDGVNHLFVRFDRNTDGLADADSKTRDRGGWAHAVSADGGDTWGPLKPVLAGDPPLLSWYGHFEPAADGDVHAVMTAYDRSAGTPYARRGVYYASLKPDGTWTDVEGSRLTTSPLKPLPADRLIESTTTPVVDRSWEYQNEVDAADDGSGNPGLLFISGKGDGDDRYRWMFSRRVGGVWKTSTITRTDHFMDAAAMSFTSSSTVEVFLVARGTSGASDSTDRYRDRGGDIERWLSTDGGVTWTRTATIMKADVNRGLVYNDPQIVDRGSAATRLVFTEWDNDAGNMIHKVFLWGEDGYKQREFFPSVTRYGGASRYDVPVNISRASFPRGADTVLMASGSAYADALTAGPLAQAYRAPILLTKSRSVPSRVLSEVVRLDPKTVIILGGERSVGPEVVSALRRKGIAVQRISGRDRYEVAQRIALKLKAKAGGPARAVVVNGTAFADALAVSPLAAARAYPILLARGDGLPSATRDAVRSLGVKYTLVVGGTRSVPDFVMRRLPRPSRVAGPDAYSTAAKVARLGLDGGYGIPASLSMTRFVVAVGNTPDALVGGALAARVRGPIVLTARASGGKKLAPEAKGVLDERAYKVLDAYVLGGDKTFTPAMAGHLAGILYERQND